MKLLAATTTVSYLISPFSRQRPTLHFTTKITKINDFNKTSTNLIKEVILTIFEKKILSLTPLIS